jgi:hypothetical protein
MRPIEIEAWALRILQAVSSGAFVEDSLVELKAEWPDATKAARRIAGQANAARGVEMLWLIGVDEKQGVKGANYNDLASWYGQVEAQFDGLAPTLHPLNVPFNGMTVAALCFDTGRAPYVVKNPGFNAPGGGAASLEVPWRDGTRTRSAHRSDLIQILVPLRLEPSLEALEGTLTLNTEKVKDEVKKTLHACFSFYISPRTEQILVFPLHKVAATVYALHLEQELRFRSFYFLDASSRSSFLALTRPSSQPSVTVHARLEPLEITTSELIVRGPRKLMLHSDADVGEAKIEQLQELEFRLSLVSAQDDVIGRMCIMCRREFAAEGQPCVWKITSRTS